MEQETKQKEKFNFEKFHDKNYKLLLLIPLALLIFSFIYLGVFYSQNNDFIYKDISLTGGTSVTIYEKVDIDNLTQTLLEKFEDINIREIYDLVTREQKAIIIEVKTDGCNELEIKPIKTILEDYLGHELINGDNASFECTGSGLSESFYKQLLIAIFAAFMAMACVVFLIFGNSMRIKIISLMGTFAIMSFLFNRTIFGGIFLLFFLISIGFFIYELFVKKIPEVKKFTNKTVLFFSFISIIFMTICIFSFGVNGIIISLAYLLFLLYFIYSIPSIAVVLAAFADILMTLVLVNMMGIQMSSAGIVAFLMLIGYSVDTDILLTTRILKRQGESLNKRIFGAFKTGMTMTLTSLLAVIFALIIVSSFSVILTQIFTILVIGLGFDLLNTWITNVSILKWYVERKK